MTPVPPTTAPPAPDVPATWHPCQPFPALKPERSFVNDTVPNDRLRVAYFLVDGEPGVYAKAWFGPGAEGPPRFAHGGSVAAVLDEALGAAAWTAGHQVVVARLAVDMREMVPLGTDATVHARIERTDGRKVYCRARLTAGADVLAEGEALCIILATEHAAALTK